MGNSNGRKVLLSSVCQPFGEKYGDGFGTSYEGTHQIMWAQGLFRTRGTSTQWGIDFIAQNLATPTTTLHYPTMGQFIDEIKRGYDYIGIAFVTATLHKMIPMVEAIRKHAPASQIVLGGYGTALGEELLAPYADHICRGEGVSYMRELLGESLDRTIEQPVIMQRRTLFSLPLLGDLGYIFAGVGCPNGCDFCATSHYYRRQHIQFLRSGRSILCAIERLREINPKLDLFWINDEDFLLDEERGRGFLEAIRESDLPAFGISVFSSVKALSKYEPSELVEMGIDWVWVGYEAKSAGYAKMEGKPYQELFAELHRHGISTLASMIIGYDYQTPEIIQQEFEELMSFRPSMCQFLIYGPSPDTPLYHRMKDEGRLFPQHIDTYNRHDGFYLQFEHPHIGAEEMQAIQRQLYHDEYARLGPTIYRVVEDFFSGYVNLRDHPAERVRAKAQKYKRDAHNTLPIILAAKRYLEPQTGEWLDNLYQEIIKETGRLNAKERLFEKIAPAILAMTHLSMRFDIGQQPKFSKRTFPEPVGPWRP
ncbi:B12-binding domain-containing radical SAM protein [Thermodesulfobacteriota bacterium]